MNSINITREESTAIKGLFMLFIILGHTKGIIEHHYTISLYFWLYSFHVTSFFILPWLYPYKYRELKSYIPQMCFRLLVPYTIFYFISYLFFHLTSDTPWNNCLNAFFSIDNDKISETIGLQSLWFLPVFLVFMIITQILRNIIKNGMFAHLIVMVLALTIYGGIFFFNSSMVFDTTNWAFCLSSYFCCALITWFCLRTPHQAVVFWGCLCCFLFLSSLYIHYNQPYNKTFVKTIMGICAFIIAFRFRDTWSKSHFLLEIGKYSLPIYLIHIYIVKICERIIGASIPAGFITYFISLISAYYISKYIFAHDTIRRMIFPVSWEDIKKSFRK